MNEQLSKPDPDLIISMINQANDSTLKKLVLTYIAESGVTNIQVDLSYNVDGVYIRNIRFNGDDNGSSKKVL